MSFCNFKFTTFPQQQNKFKSNARLLIQVAEWKQRERGEKPTCLPVLRDDLLILKEQYKIEIIFELACSLYQS